MTLINRIKIPRKIAKESLKLKLKTCHLKTIKTQWASLSSFMITRLTNLKNHEHSCRSFLYNISAWLCHSLFTIYISCFTESSSESFSYSYVGLLISGWAEKCSLSNARIASGEFFNILLSVFLKNKYLVFTRFCLRNEKNKN